MQTNLSDVAQMVEGMLHSLHSTKTCIRYTMPPLPALGSTTCTITHAESKPDVVKLQIDVPASSVIIVVNISVDKIGTSAGVHARTKDGLPGQFLYGYLVDKQGIIGPYHQG